MSCSTYPTPSLTRRTTHFTCPAVPTPRPHSLAGQHILHVLQYLPHALPHSQDNTFYMSCSTYPTPSLTRRTTHFTCPAVPTPRPPSLAGQHILHVLQYLPHALPHSQDHELFHMSCSTYPPPPPLTRRTTHFTTCPAVPTPLPLPHSPDHKVFHMSCSTYHPPSLTRPTTKCSTCPAVPTTPPSLTRLTTKCSTCPAVPTTPPPSLA